MSDDARILELEASGWWSYPNQTNLDETTERRVTGTCVGFNEPIYTDDTGETYDEMCEA